MEPARPELAGRVVLITGGGSGIGRATALRFAAAGARVMVCGLTRTKLEATASLARAAPGEIAVMEADISVAAEMERLYRAVEQRWNRLDVIFANAGINGVWAPLEQLTPEEWEKTLRVNLTGTFYTVKFGLPLLKRSGGAIIVTSSINGTAKFSDVGSSAYSASKAGQVGLMKLLALELAEAKIRVNAICPGSIATSIEEHMEMRDTEASGEYARFPRGVIPLTEGDPGQPEQVADLVLFLASARAAHITGAVITIDGGQSLIQ